MSENNNTTENPAKEKAEERLSSRALFGSFDWDAFRLLEKSLGPIEEKVIRQQVIQTMEGNDCCDDFGTSETATAAEFFRFGWICARLAILPNAERRRPDGERGLKQ
jgi:hypothetical protein